MKGSLDPERITKAIRVPLDTSGLALPKPTRPEHSQPKDGRLIESPKEYRITKRQMWERQHKRCIKCSAFLPSPAHAHRHHTLGTRGLGGGKRDDRKTILICIPCHRKEHGQR